MNFKTERVACPFCGTKAMTAETDQANNLILVCDKCGSRFKAEAVVNEIAAQHARESNQSAVGLVGIAEEFAPTLREIAVQSGSPIHDPDEARRIP